MFKSDFPIFSTHPDLIYLDSAASAQKPAVVIEAIANFYRTSYANIHRGLYPLSIQATQAYEEARQTVANFIGAEPAEVVFTKSGTEALNLLAWGLTESLQPGDEIILSELEHHANVVPWQQAASRHNLTLRFVKITNTGELDLENFRTLISPKTKLVSLSQCSNVLGTITSFPAIKKILTEQGSDALVIADACQSVAHFPLSVTDLEVDFVAFSGHKLYGPSGSGVLWGRSHLLDTLPPYQTGGDMVQTVTPTTATWQPVPQKFEAGTPNIEGAVGLAAAIRYLQEISMEKVAQHTAEITSYALEKLRAISGVQLLSNPAPESGIIAFTIEDMHPHDLAEMLAEQHICIRAGHHCVAPLHNTLNIAASARISIGLYNEKTDIDACVAAIEKSISYFRNV